MNISAYEKGYLSYYNDLELWGDDPYRDAKTEEEKENRKQWQHGWIDAQAGYLKRKCEILS